MADELTEKEICNRVKFVYGIFLLYFIILDIGTYSSGKNFIAAIATNIIAFLIFIVFHKKITESIKKYIKRSKVKNVNTRIIIYKMTYMFVFALLPMMFFMILINGQWQYNSMSEKFSLTSDGAETQYFVNHVGSVKILSYVNEDILTKFSYILGNSLNLPILDVCFVNNGIDHKNIFNESFDSKLTFSGNTHSIQLYDEYCEPVIIKNQNIDYIWTTQYKFDSASNLDQSPPENFVNQVIVKMNVNAWIMLGLIYLIWVGICSLTYNVIKDYKEIK